MYLFAYNYLCPFVFVEAISLLCIFKNNKVNESLRQFTIDVSKSTFGIYIFHTTPFICGIVYPLLNKWTDSNILTYFLLFALTSVAVFFVSFLVELCRNKLFAIIRAENMIEQIDIAFGKIILRYFES